MRLQNTILISSIALALTVSGCSDDSSDTDTADNSNSNSTSTSTSNSTTATGSAALTAEVWADNWFALYVDDALVMEDSVPITTERSFNEEQFTFNATYPFTLNFIVKDFKENDSGLEYIGAPNQQIGDGGFVAQIKDSSGALVAVTDSNWKCLAIHKAPLNKDCVSSSDPSNDCTSDISEEPSGWKAADFDTTGWEDASVYSREQVRPKDGYDRVSWDDKAKLVWTSDLETDNTLLCKLTVNAP